MKLVVPLVTAVLASVALVCAQYSRRKKEDAAYAALITGLAQPQQYRDAPIVIVVDVGSSSIRASCFALLHHKPSGSSRSSSSIHSDGVEWVLITGSLQQLHSDCIDANGEADIHQIAAKVETVLDGALRFLRVTQLSSKVVGVGFSTFAMNILGIDEKVGICGSEGFASHKFARLCCRDANCWGCSFFVAVGGTRFASVYGTTLKAAWRYDNLRMCDAESIILLAMTNE